MDVFKAEAERESAVEGGGHATEKEMREGKPPRIDSVEELAKYIQSLIDRPHTYGTCVYAMSYAAVAAMDMVAVKLGVSGFQHSCADLDVLRMTRNLKFGCVVDYEKLLFPQYCTDEHFPSVDSLLRTHSASLAEMAKDRLSKADNHVHPNVRSHWEKLASAQPPA